MREEISACDIYNELLITRTYHNGTIIIFESDNDIRNFKKFFSNENCEYIPAHGKKNATKTIKMAERDSIGGVLAIVDNDYWFIEKIKIESTNILVTDSHDSETMILQSEALDNFLTEFTEEAKMIQFLKENGMNIRDFLLEKGKFIGIFRLILTTYTIKAFILRDLRFARIFDITTFEIELENLIWESLKKTLKSICILDNFMKLKSWILISLINIDKKKYDLWHLCSGHDLIKILNLCLKSKFGDSHGRAMGQTQIEKILRATYAYNYFKSTELCKSLKKWEKNNSGFIIFR